QPAPHRAVVDPAHPREPALVATRQGRNRRAQFGRRHRPCPATALGGAGPAGVSPAASAFDRVPPDGSPRRGGGGSLAVAGFVLMEIVHGDRLASSAARASVKAASDRIKREWVGSNRRQKRSATSATATVSG
ncbi:hypothetical protein RZS08_21455, partial [Arthrospira platensis SPKY1]|nr:hypothetical protein [Arthrospira platensis SPKY1]